MNDRTAFPAGGPALPASPTDPTRGDFSARAHVVRSLIRCALVALENDTSGIPHGDRGALGTLHVADWLAEKLRDDLEPHTGNKGA